MKVEKHMIPDRATWLEWRRADVTASDIPAITGHSPYKTAVGVWAEKAGLAEPIETPAMRAGRWLEDAVIAAMVDKHPNWTIGKPGMYLRAPEHRVGATPDAIAYDEKHHLINIECKTVGRSQFLKWAGEPPLGYQLQCATQAMLLDARYSILAVMPRSEWECELFEFRIERNARAEARVLEMVNAFWDSVERGETPAVDYARDINLIAKVKPPKPELEAIEFTNDNRLPEILAEHELLKAEEKTVAQRIAEIRTEIITKLNGHPVATCEGWRIKHQIQQQHVKAHEAFTRTVARLSISRDAK